MRRPSGFPTIGDWSSYHVIVVEEQPYRRQTNLSHRSNSIYRQITLANDLGNEISHPQVSKIFDTPIIRSIRLMAFDEFGQ
jgi:hypothetical protein